MTDEAAAPRGPEGTGPGPSDPTAAIPPATPSAPSPAAAASVTPPAGPGAPVPDAPAGPAADPTVAFPAAAARGDEVPAADPGGEAPAADPGGEAPAADPGDEAPAADPGDEAPAADPAGPPPGAERSAAAPPPPAAPGAPPPPPPGAGAPPPPPPPPGAGPPPPPPGAGGHQPPRPAFTFSRERLIRPRQGRYLAGVCGALGRATGTDPVLWRVVLAVLACFSGVGVVLYLLGWLLVPAEGDTASPLESLLGRGRSGTSPVATALLALATVAAFGLVARAGLPGALVGVAVLAGGILLVRRYGHPAPVAADPAAGFAGPAAYAAPAPGQTPPAYTPPAYPPPGPGAGPGYPPPGPTPPGPGHPPPPGYGPPPPAYGPPAGGYRPPFAPHGPFAAPVPAEPPPAPAPPRPPRERSVLGRLTFFVGVLVLGVLGLLDLGGLSVPVSGYFAAALAVTGLGLVVGAWFGRARWLIALALPVALGLGAATAAEDAGDVLASPVFRPRSAAELATAYDVGAGNATLDLRGVDFTGQTRQTTVTAGPGQLRVLLPPAVDTTAAVSLERGRARVLGQVWSGDDLTPREVTDLGTDGAGGGSLRLTVTMDTGNLEVVR